MTDNIDAFFNLAIPVTPWPTVHPPANAVPIPTRNPATASTPSSKFLIKDFVSKG